MEITTTTIHELKWDFPDSNEFSAMVTNGKITELHFQDVGDLTVSDLESINEKYLRNIYKALKGLFQHLDTIRNVGNAHFAVEEEEEELGLRQFKEQIKSLEYGREKDLDKELDERILFIKK